MRRHIGFVSFLVELIASIIFLSMPFQPSVWMILFFITGILWFLLSMTYKLLVMSAGKTSKLGFWASVFISVPGVIYLLAVPQALSTPDTVAGSIVGVLVVILWFIDLVDNACNPCK